MGVQRSPTGHQAFVLQEALKARLAANQDQWLNSRIVQAIKVCERFLKSCHATPAGLGALKGEVHRIMTAPIKDKRRPQVDDSPRTHTGQKSTTLPSISSKPSTPQEDVDLSMPRELLENKGFSKVVGFSHIAKLQDTIQAADMRKQAANKQAFHAKTRDFLNGQMRELEQRRAEEAEARRRDGIQLDADICQQRQEDCDRHQARLHKQAETRDDFARQAGAARAYRQRLKDQEMRRAQLERAQQEEEDRKARAAAARKAAADLENCQAFSRELINAIARKRALLDQEKEDEAEYNRAYMKRMDEEQKAREDAVAARRRKMETAFLRGGGAALQASMEQQARESEATALRQQAEYDAAQREKQRREQQERFERNMEQKRILEQQLAAKKRAEQEEACRALELRHKTEADVTAFRAAQKAQKQQSKTQKSEDFAKARRAYLDEQRRRFESAQDRIPDDMMWLHKDVLCGKTRAFTTLEVTRPCV